MSLQGVCGLRLKSAVRIPGAKLLRGGAPDWTVRLVSANPDRVGAQSVRWTGHVRDAGRRWCLYGRDGALVRVRVAGWFDLEADGESRRVVVRGRGGRDGEARVLRRVLPYLAAMTGPRLALHASAAVFPAGAVLFCAESRTGKSTLALALDAVGVPVLGDDHVVVDLGADGRLWARPSVGWAEVSARSVRQFRPDVRSGARGDRVVSLRTPRSAEGAPVAALTFLRRGRRPGYRVTSSRAALPRLLRRFAFLGDPADDREQAERFDLACRLTTTVPVGSVTLPEGLGRLAREMGPLLRRWERPSNGAPVKDL